MFVFCLRGAAKGLQRWNDNSTRPSIETDRAVEELILDLEGDVQLWRDDEDGLLGFGRQPKARAAAERLGGRLVAGLASPLGTPGRQFIFSARLGAAAFDPSTGTAEAAMDAATTTASQTNFDTPFLLHNGYIAERSRRHRRTGVELPEAIAAGAITVEFQARVTPADHRIVGIEALARWKHPERGSIPTQEFLEVAERQGILAELGRRVRADGVNVARAWQHRGLVDHCRLWMNLAPVELCHPDLMASVAELSGRRPYLSIGFEVADSRLLEDLAFLRVFDRLQELGVHLALDNFNPASKSFGRIRRLPVSMINLDGELVRSLPTIAPNRDLVRLTCSVAAGRGIAVTACGIETEEQLEVAELCGVDLVQGYGVHQVMGPDAMAGYLAGGHPGRGGM